MKLSDFLQEKKIVFGGELPHVISPSLDGEVIFYNLDTERIKFINENIIQKLNEGETKESVTYKMFPHLVDIEADVTLEKFVEMLNNPPNNEFANVVNELYDAMENLFNRAATVSEIHKKNEEMLKRMPELAVTPIKTKEEIEKELMAELGGLIENTPENKARRKEIFTYLAELEG